MGRTATDNLGRCVCAGGGIILWCIIVSLRRVIYSGVTGLVGVCFSRDSPNDLVMLFDQEDGNE